MPRKPGFRKKAPTPKKRSYRKKKSSPSTRTITRIVKREIHREAENKWVFQDYNTTTPVFPNATGTFPQQFDLTPLISQGVTTNAREGNKARLMSAKLFWRWNLSGAAQTANVDQPLLIYMLIGRPRNNQNGPTTTETDQMFYVATGSTGSFNSGSGVANAFKPNREFWDIKYWTYRPIKLGASVQANSGFDNNDFPAFRSGVIDCTKMYRKTLRFNNSGTTANSNNLYLYVFIQKYNLDIATVNWDPPQFNARLTVNFEDF